MRFFQRNTTFSQGNGSFFQQTQEPQERCGKYFHEKSKEAPQLPHQPFAETQRHRAEGDVIHQPAEELAAQQVEPHRAVAHGQKEEKTYTRAAQAVEDILDEQGRAAVFPGQQAQDPEQVVEDPQGEAKAQAEQKQPGLVGDGGQVVHQRKTLPKKPPVLFGASSW